MKNLLLLIALTTTAGPVNAGLGAAVTEKPNTIRAWCGKPLNDCVVRFEDGRMKVDNSDGITEQQIKQVNTSSSHKSFWWPPAARNPNGLRWEVQVSYEENGKDHVASFLFVNEEGANELNTAIQRFAPNLRPLGPSIRIDKK